MQSFAEWAFERAPAGMLPQVVYADEFKKAIRWVPGNKDQMRTGKPQATRFIGYTPGAFQYPHWSQHNQSVAVCWSGLDIDDHVDEARERLELLPEVALRTSSSGRGLHAFVRFTRPVMLDPGHNRHVVCEAAWVSLLERVNFPRSWICSSGYRAFYVEGGLQEWIKFSEKDVEPCLMAAPKRERPVEHVAPMDVEIEKPVSEVVKRLEEAGIKLSIGRNQIYVRDVYEALQGTPFEFETKSGMRLGGKPHVNGFIDLAPNRIVIIPNADGHPVLDIRSRSFWRL